jgi:hypothetical protein
MANPNVLAPIPSGARVNPPPLMGRVIDHVVVRYGRVVGAYRVYTDALQAIANTIHERKQHDINASWTQYTIVGHSVDTVTVGCPDYVRVFRRDGRALTPQQDSEELKGLRRSNRLNGT